jgi:hypothetical protein
MPTRAFWAALSINCIALVLVSILVAAGTLPDNWIIAPLYILACSFAHKPFLQLELTPFLLVQIVTFMSFPFINWGVIAIILSVATI